MRPRGRATSSASQIEWPIEARMPGRHPSRAEAFPPRRFNMRKLTFLVLCATLAVGVAANATALPQNIPAGSKLVFKWNMIGYPAGQTYNGNCGNGDRLFVNRDASKAQVLVTNGTSWAITDCNATATNRGTITTAQAGLYDIYARILGKPGGHINICAQTLVDFTSGDTLCLLGTIDLTRAKGQSKFELEPSSMFDASLQDILWTVDTNPAFRIVQFRVYQRP
jgi:hypothetical protein